MIKVESNIPIPKPTYNWKEELFNMKVNDSFLTDKKYYMAILYAAKIMGYRITMRTEDKQARIWLVSK